MVLRSRISSKRVRIGKSRALMRRRVIGGSIKHIKLGNTDMEIDHDDTNLENLKNSLKQLNLHHSTSLKSSRKNEKRKYIKF
jgi:hypothetical protein